jgi:hypothetical protein
MQYSKVYELLSEGLETDRGIHVVQVSSYALLVFILHEIVTIQLNTSVPTILPFQNSLKVCSHTLEHNL